MAARLGRAGANAVVTVSRSLDSESLGLYATRTMGGLAHGSKTARIDSTFDDVSKTKMAQRESKRGRYAFSWGGDRASDDSEARAFRG